MLRYLFMFGLVSSAVSLAQAATGPIRVLYFGKEGPASTRRAHVLMRELGRDAIWFDYTSETAAPAPQWAARFDAFVTDPEFTNPQTLTSLPRKLVFTANLGDDEKIWASEESLSRFRERLFEAIGDQRRKDWEAFLAPREPERREPHAAIANYERRREAVTLQHPFGVKGSKERTQVAPDLRLELFAAEPDIAKPIAFAWDERGRCWVAETRDYPHAVQPDGQGNDSIKICEDTDGDGRADKFTVFADKLNLPTSLVFVNGGVIVSQPPRFLFLADTNGDDKADVRREIMTGWGIGDTHAQANSLHYGIDNWLYGCVGYSGYSAEVNGARKQFAQGTYRFKPDGTGLEFLHQFSNNSWGQSANEAGDQFGGTANGAPIFYGGIRPLSRRAVHA